MAHAKVRKPPKPKKPRKPPLFHEQAGAGSAGKAQGAVPRGVSAAGSGPSAVMDLVASDSAAAGLSTVVLELAGEGKVSLASALSAWHHEQERVSNRIWRRPGGLARMGGL